MKLLITGGAGFTVGSSAKVVVDENKATFRY